MINSLQPFCAFFCRMDIGDTMETAIDFLKIVVEIILLVIGTTTFSRYKKKKEAAAFTFWSQFHAYLIEILSWLEQGECIVNNLYTSDLRIKREESNAIFTPETLYNFKGRVEEVIRFIQTADNQIPACKGFTKNYNYVIRCMFDMISYDICDPDKRFKYRKQDCNICAPEVYVNKLYEAVNCLCTSIETEQIKIENKICKKRKQNK